MKKLIVACCFSTLLGFGLALVPSCGVAPPGGGGSDAGGGGGGGGAGGDTAALRLCQGRCLTCCTQDGFCVDAGISGVRNCGSLGALCQTCEQDAGAAGSTCNNGNVHNNQCLNNDVNCGNLRCLNSAKYCVDAGVGTAGPCGTGGSQCRTCPANHLCNTSGNCEFTGDAGCPGGCKQGQECLNGFQVSACGNDGGACVACPPGSRCAGGVCEVIPCAERCSGCCSGNTCLAGTSNTACGSRGLACVNCTTGTGLCSFSTDRYVCQ